MKKIHINNDDNYATPPEFYEELNKRFNFDFDPCPYNENEILNDGLKIEWGKSNFVNPPYSQKLKEEFIKKGVAESKKGKVCVFLIPVSTSTKLFHELIKPNATEIIFVKGRIKFGKRDHNGSFYLPLNDKGKTQSGTKDSMIVVFGSEQKAMIEDVTVFSLLQKYDDGRPDRVWSIGDITKDGKITSFAKGTGDYWYALTDTPSEWQIQNGMKNGWSWIFQLEAVS